MTTTTHSSGGKNTALGRALDSSALIQTCSNCSPGALLRHQLCSQGCVRDGLLGHVRHALQVIVALRQRMGVAHHAPHVLQAHARGCCQAVLDVQPGFPHDVQAVPALPSACKVNRRADGAALAAAIIQLHQERRTCLLAWAEQPPFVCLACLVQRAL